MEGKLPIISEQIRYNRQLVKDGESIQKSIWECQSCLKNNYSNMPDLKTICKPCKRVPDLLKPRKLINRLPDLDMWVICEDEKIEKTQYELKLLLKQNNMHTSDENPILSINDILRISQELKYGIMPKIFLPIDTHIIECSKLRHLIEQVPDVLRIAKEEKNCPYLPIYPKSYRKDWQYDDEPYNYIYDFLAAFTEFNFSKELQQALNRSRLQVSSENSEDELFELLIQSANKANIRRFQTTELKEYFKQKIQGWRLLERIEPYKSNLENNRKGSIMQVKNNDYPFQL